MKLSKADDAELRRMFVHRFKPDRPPAIGGEITTNNTCTKLATLHSLARKGLITYDDAEAFGAFWGVKAWNVKLTPKGYEYLKQAVASETA